MESVALFFCCATPGGIMGEQKKFTTERTNERTNKSTCERKENGVKQNEIKQNKTHKHTRQKNIYNKVMCTPKTPCPWPIRIGAKSITGKYVVLCVVCICLGFAIYLTSLYFMPFHLILSVLLCTSFALSSVSVSSNLF